MESTNTEIFVRPKECKFNSADLPVIQNLISLGYSESDAGMIMGYQGSNWKLSAGKTLPEYKEAIEAGIKAADAALVHSIAQEAKGYEYTEVKETFKAVPDFDKETGQDSIKMVKVGETRTTKRIPGNAKLAELLAVNRLPEMFKKVTEINKKIITGELTGEMTDKQVDGLVGRLLEAIEKKKIIEAEVIEE